MSTIAILPLRSLADGKQRLRDVLAPDQRTALIQQVFRHTLRAIRDADVIDACYVVSPDDPTLAWASAQGALPIKQPDHGLNAGLEHARQEIGAQPGVASIVIVLPDLPFVRAADVAAFVARGAADTVVLASDRHGVGTNALLLPRAPGVPFCFGSDSLAAHEAVARAAGFAVVHDRNARWAFDLDTADDLQIVRDGARGLLDPLQQTSKEDESCRRL